MAKRNREGTRGRPPATPAPAEIAATTATMQVVSVDDLIPDAANPRRRDERANKAIDASLGQFGPGRSILVGATRVVRAGNGTLERFAAGGGNEVLLVRPAPGQLVAVQRDDLTPTQEVALGIADNRTADLATNDEVELATLLAGLESEGFDLAAAGYSEKEFEDLKQRLGTELAGPHAGAGVSEIPQTFSILIEFADEAGQRAMFERLESEGHTCRLLTS